MSKKLAVGLVGALGFFASFASAEEEVSAWYLSEGGEYLVRDSVHGELHALLSMSKAGQPYVYIIMSDPDCEADAGNIETHNPLYVNGTLTRYSQYCEGSRRYFLPATNAGRVHLIEQFSGNDFVEIKTHDETFRTLFSAQGFEGFLQKTLLREQGI